MSREAIDIAHNALAMLEEDSSVDTTRLRSLLPALALDFEKAGRPLSERLLVRAVLKAHENNVPLHTLFTQSRKTGPDQLTYEEIAARLNPDFFQPRDITRILDFGLMPDFERYHGDAEYSEKSYRDLIKRAAKNGHTDMCHFAVSFCNNRHTALASTIQSAMEASQYHLVHETIEAMTQEESDLVTDYLQNNINTLKTVGYRAFQTLLKDHKRTNKDVKPEALTGLENWQNMGFRMTPYLGIRELFSNEQPNIRTRNQIAFTTTMLFQTPERVLQFLDRWGQQSTAPLSHLINQIDPPYTKHVKWHAWGDALIKYGPGMFYPVHFATQFPEPLRGINGEISMRATRNAIWNKCFPQDDSLRSVSELCYRWRVKSDDISRATTLWEKRLKIDQPDHTRIPDIEIDCEELGLSGYSMKKLSHDDPRMMFLGYYTGCCEKIGDFFEETVELSLNTRQHGYYVITQDNEIKAHSWAWRGERHQLIIDGWESEDPNIDSELLSSLMELMGDRLSAESYDSYEITDVMIGLSGEHLKPHEYFLEAKDTAKRFACEWYFPGDCQWLVKRIAAPPYLPPEKPKLEPK